MLQLFRQRDFVAYFSARQAGIAGASIENVAVGWQVFLLRHSAFDLGLVGLVMFAPGLLLALPAGYLADRLDRKLVCIVCASGECAAMLLLVALAFSRSTSLALYLGAAFLVGTAHALLAPAERSMLAGLLDADGFVRGQAITSSLSRLIQVASPAAGGALLLLGAPVAFGAAAAAYALSAASYGVLRPRKTMEARAVRWSDAARGITFIASHQIVLAAISLDLFAVLFGGATALLPVYADSILHVGPAGLGLLRSAPAVGAATVALWIARHPLRRNIGRRLLLTVAGFGAATIVFGASRNLWLSLGALVATGGFDMVSVVIRNLLVQLETPDAMRGRVSAVENVFIGASNELGEFESGMLASLLGAPGSVVAGGVGTLLVIALWTILFPRLSAFDQVSTATAAEEAAALDASLNGDDGGERGA